MDTRKRKECNRKKTIDYLNSLPIYDRKIEELKIKRMNYLIYCKRNGIIADPDMYKNKYTKIKSTDTIEEKKEKCKYNIEYYKAVLESLESNTIQQLTTNESNGSNPNADICGNSNSGSEEETE